MKTLFLLLALTFSIGLQSQSKSEILNNIENILKQQTIKSDDYKVTVYYNVEEKILDFDEIGELNKGLILQLNNISIKYESNPYHKDTHYLKISCKENNGCIESKDSQTISSLTRAFASKKIVYELIDLIHQLRKL